MGLSRSWICDFCTSRRHLGWLGWENIDIDRRISRSDCRVSSVSPAADSPHKIVHAGYREYHHASRLPLLIHVLDEGFHVIRSYFIVFFFSVGILSAVLSFVAIRRSGTTHSSIHIPPNRGLTRNMLGVNLGVSVSENSFSGRRSSSLVISG